MIEGWNSKHLCKRVCMQAAREAQFVVSLTVGTPELADSAELQRCNLIIFFLIFWLFNGLGWLFFSFLFISILCLLGQCHI